VASLYYTHVFLLEKFAKCSYSGEEGRTAKWTSWGNIAPGLSERSIGYTDVLDLLKRRFVSSSAALMISSLPMVIDSDWPSLARGLFEYGLCEITQPH
jgi:hypothetical protein